MDVSQVVKNRLVSKNQTNELPLKKGSIVRGTILKLYPQNRAQIQLGSQVLIAQLEAPLQLGGKYHFQVESADDILHLRVFGERINNQSTNNIDKLLQLLNLKTTKTNTGFLQQIVNENIPFSKEQLSNALAIIEEAPNKQQTAELLKTMFIKRLPITNNVFQALYQANTTSLSNQLRGLGDQLQNLSTKTETQQQLVNMIDQLTGKTGQVSQPVVMQIIAEASSNNYQLFNLFKAANIIDSNLNYATWKSYWVGTERTATGTENTPFKFDQVNAQQMIQKGSEISQDIKQTAQVLVKKWSQQIMSTDHKLLSNNFEQFKQDILTRLQPLLSNDVRQQIVKLLQNEPQQLRQLMTYLETLTTSRTNILITNTVNVPGHATMPLANPKQSFLVQLNNVSNLLGLSYENTLAENIVQQDPTIKSMLIQMLSQTEGESHERGQQLLHFINGVQLDSIQETTNFIQANIHVPGEKLGLNEDLFIEFESKKTADGKINPDYCRIIFYLDLAYIDKTVIDMHVHNRLVSLTIYASEQTEIENLAHALQPTLKSGLLELDYQLISVVFKPLINDGNKQIAHDKIRHSLQDTYEGIDFRI